MPLYPCMLNGNKSTGQDPFTKYFGGTNNAVWTAPRTGRVKIWLLPIGTIKGINQCIITATLCGVSGTGSSYESSFSHDKPLYGQGTGYANVTENTTYKCTVSTQGNVTPSYVAFCVGYID